MVFTASKDLGRPEQIFQLEGEGLESISRRCARSTTRRFRTTCLRSTASNSWSLQSGGPTSPTTIENAGTVVGTRGILDLSAGAGLLWSVSDTGSAILAQDILDTTLAQTLANDQSGADLLCAAASTVSPGRTFSCSMNPSLGAYTTGMLIRFTPDVSIVGGLASTVNVDALGAVAIEKADGVTNPASTDVLAGQLYQLWYDGTVFRLLGGTAGPAGPQGPAGSVAVIASGTVALGTSTIPSGTCAAAVTSAATGVTTSDNIQSDFSADPTSITGYSPASGGILSVIRFPTANAVNFKVCNNTAASVTPGAITLNWRVFR